MICHLILLDLFAFEFAFFITEAPPPLVAWTPLNDKRLKHTRLLTLAVVTRHVIVQSTFVSVIGLG
jgi:hypothetical protein